MRRGLLISLPALLTSAGLALAQPPAPQTDLAQVDIVPRGGNVPVQWVQPRGNASSQWLQPMSNVPVQWVQPGGNAASQWLQPVGNTPAQWVQPVGSAWPTPPSGRPETACCWPTAPPCCPDTACGCPTPPVCCPDAASGCSTSVCPESGCPPTMICAPRYRIWAQGEYLLWWIKDSPLPPLVTSSPAGSVPSLGRPETALLFGGNDVDNKERSGGRFTLGYWLDECEQVGIESSYLFLGSRSVTFAAGAPGTPGTPVLGVPFFDILAGAENAQVFASPGMMAGNIQIQSASRLQGYELNGLYNVSDGCLHRLDLMVGFRYLQLDEGLNIAENFTVAPGVPIFGSNQFRVTDEFAAHTRFYGGQLGARAEFRRRNWSLDVVTKIAVGSSHEVVGINGTTVIVQPGGAPSPGRGGVLALATNSGRGSQDEFAVLPEVGVTVGYWVTDSMKAFVGYHFLYLSEAVRPGEQIDRTLNISQIPSMGPNAFTGPPRPAFTMNGSDYWAQGISFGFEWRY